MSTAQGHPYDTNAQRNVQSEINIGLRDVQLQLARLCQCMGGGGGGGGGPLQIQPDDVRLMDSTVALQNQIFIIPRDCIAFIVRNESFGLNEVVYVNKFPVLPGEIYTANSNGYNRYFPANTITVDGLLSKGFYVQWIEP